MTAPSPERARLSSCLRELRGRTGLSLAALAAKTAFSKSSWDRYLNGRTLPPRDAVQELCRLAGEPEGRCLALWEIAEAEGSGRGGRPVGAVGAVGSGVQDSSPPPAAAPFPPPSPSPQEVTPAVGAVGGTADAVHRSAMAMAVLASVCAAAVGGFAALAFLLPHGDGDPRSSLPPSPAVTGPRCLGAGCEGENPKGMQCDVAPTTVATHRTATGAWMELRYSEECGTSWARMWGTRVGDRIEMTAGGGEGPVRSAEVHDAVDADNYVYTPMTAAPPGTVARACFRPAAGGEPECFDGRVNPA
ncbi:helix-turn-helix domain-containing protein [Streptomyces bicolor]|uniref:helix-turn-helix domain-containing protein n=1 Tax=Streptomyces bicolor TaxID=66874 RepID=UPI0004E21EEA|nr:XRE family transcriptional regulator [Streptomyces bicolor]